MHRLFEIARKIIRLKVLPNKRTIIALLINHIDRETVVHLLLGVHTIGLLLCMYQLFQITRKIIRLKIQPNKLTFITLLINHIKREAMVY